MTNCQNLGDIAFERQSSWRNVMDKQFNDFSDSDRLDRPQAGAFRGIGPYQW